MNRRGFLALFGGAALVPLLPSIPAAKASEAKIVLDFVSGRAIIAGKPVTMSAYLKEGGHWTRVVSHYGAGHEGPFELRFGRTVAHVWNPQFECEASSPIQTSGGLLREESRTAYPIQANARVDGTVLFEPFNGGPLA